MALDPLLRSTNPLRALFHRATVITEADADRAFYDEINRRLVTDKRGVEDALFINAQNWQTIHRVVAPLRRIGIPAAAVVDLDVLADQPPATSWKKLLDASAVPAGPRADWDMRRDRVVANIRIQTSTSQLGPLKHGGIGLLPTQERAEADALLDELAAYGIFVVPGGGLESWLQSLGVGGDKSEWLIRVFERIGSATSDPAYVAAGQGDVWAFLERIARWVNDPNRLGVP